MIDISFEFFPPKTAAAEVRLWDSVARLTPLAPHFVSVTYGAGGTTRTRTHECVRRLFTETDLTPAAHLTCVAASRSEVDSVIADYAQIGIRHIVALRGDMPDMGVFRSHPRGYASAVELVESCAVRGFEVSVAAYPEPHPESQSLARDIEILRAKLAAGARRAVTQFVFDTDAWFRFRDALVAAGLEVSLVPGIMPTTNFKAAQNMAKKCGATIPPELIARFAPHIDDVAACEKIATEFAQFQCEKLIGEGFTQLHFYTLNQADVTFNICAALGLGGAK